MSIEMRASATESPEGVKVTITSEKVITGSSISQIIGEKRNDRAESKFRETAVGVIGVGLAFAGLVDVIHGMSANDGSMVVEATRTVLLGLFMISYSAEVGKNVRNLDGEIIAIEAIQFKSTDIPA